MFNLAPLTVPIVADDRMMRSVFAKVKTETGAFARVLSTEATKVQASLARMQTAMAAVQARAVAFHNTLASVGVGGGIGLTLAAGLGVSAFIKNSIEAQKTLAQLEAAIASTGGAAGLSSRELTAMASEMQRVTTYGDDAVISAQALLMTFTKVGRDVFPEAIATILDMSTAMGQDLKSSTIQVGKALNDPIKGITALTRVGVSFTEAQKLMIESLVKAGDVAGAQAIILRELQTEFGGSASAARNTLGGALTALQNSFGDLFEVSGDGSRKLTDAINSLVDTLSDPATIAAVQGFGAALFDAFGETVRLFRDNPWLLGLVTGAVVGGRVGGVPGAVLGGVVGVGEALKPTFTTIEEGKAKFDVLRDGVRDAIAALHDVPAAAAAASRAVQASADDMARATGVLRQGLAGTSGPMSPGLKARFGDAFGDTDKAAARAAPQQAAAIKRVIDQLKFEEEQLGRTAREQAIYNALKQAGVGINSDAGREIADVAGRLYDAREAQEKLNDKLREAEGYASGFTGTLVDGLIKGEGIASALGDAIGGLSSKLGGFASDFLGKIGGGGIFGSILSGVGGGLVGSLVKGIGGLIDSIFGNNDAEERAERQRRREERRLRLEEKQDRIDARRERLQEREERRLARLEASMRRRESFEDRAFVAGLDQDTLEGRLARFDLEAQREREELARTAGKKFNREVKLLDEALAAERLNIIKEFNEQAIEEARRAAEEMNRVARGIVDYVNDLNTGSDSPLSPQDRLTAAQQAYNTQLALAQGGDLSAQSTITSYADALIKSARDFWASGPDFQAIFNQVKTDLLGLPAVGSSSDPVVQKLAEILIAQQNLLNATGTLQTAVTETTAAVTGQNPILQATQTATEGTKTGVDPLQERLIEVRTGLTTVSSALGTTNARLLTINTSLGNLGTRIDQLNRNIVGTTKAGTVDNIKAGERSALGLTESIFRLSKSVTGWLAAVEKNTRPPKGKKPKVDDSWAGYTPPTTGVRMGGLIPGYAMGGMVGNGVWDRDSVLARYAGGGSVALAGGEFVTRAPSVNAMTMPILDAINRTGRMPMPDMKPNFEMLARVFLAGMRAQIETLQTEVAVLRQTISRGNDNVARAVREKPVAKPATKVA